MVVVVAFLLGFCGYLAVAMLAGGRVNWIGLGGAAAFVLMIAGLQLYEEFFS